VQGDGSWEIAVVAAEAQKQKKPRKKARNNRTFN